MTPITMEPKLGNYTLLYMITIFLYQSVKVLSYFNLKNLSTYHSFVHIIFFRCERQDIPNKYVFIFLYIFANNQNQLPVKKFLPDRVRLIEQK